MKTILAFLTTTIVVLGAVPAFADAASSEGIVLAGPATTSGWTSGTIQPSAVASAFTNGDFETGDRAGWTNTSSGNGSWFVYNGTRSPMSNQTISAPPQGRFAATTDQTGPGNHTLAQTFQVPTGPNVTLSFTLYYENRAGAFATPDTLSYASGSNQQYRVDLMSPSAAHDSVAPSDVVRKLYRTEVGAASYLPPTRMCFDVSSYANMTLSLRFAEVDNMGYLHASVDDVRVGTGCTATPSEVDLIVHRVDVYPQGNGGFVFAAHVRNVGSTTAPASLTMFMLRADLYTGVHTPTIPPGGEVRVETTPSPPLQPGQHNITVTADVDNVIAESNETNNVLVAPFTVPSSDMSLSSLSYKKPTLATDYTDPLVNPAGAWNITASVQNAGDAGCFVVSFVVMPRLPGPVSRMSSFGCHDENATTEVSVMWRPQVVGDVDIVATLHTMMADVDETDNEQRAEAFVLVGGLTR